MKRGLMTTIKELPKQPPSTSLAGGNDQVMLCERGIRTFETATRNTLDLSAVCVLKEKTHLPVVVDPSHATGQPPLRKAPGPGLLGRGRRRHHGGDALHPGQGPVRRGPVPDPQEFKA